MNAAFAILFAALSIWDYPARFSARQLSDLREQAARRETVAAKGTYGSPIVLGEQNLSWDFDVGCFVAQMTLENGTNALTCSTGDLYVNRDGGHSVLDAKAYPGLTVVRFDAEGHKRQMDLDEPNTIFPYPVFGNCSRAYVGTSFWRSIPRYLSTARAADMRRYLKLYLANQTWVFPSNEDTAPVGTNGDVFASITPYWLVSAGRSFSDLPLLRAALDASRTLNPSVKKFLVKQGLLAPTIQTLVRKSLPSVKTEDDYLTAAAHPTALPTNIDTERLVAAAKELTVETIPPVVPISVTAAPTARDPVRPELTYGTAFAWAYVLRTDDERRVFTITARWAQEVSFTITHGREGSARIEKLGPNTARVTVYRSMLSPTNRVDVTVVGRNPGTGWGAPSYVSFACMDLSAPYSDPVLTQR